MLKTEWIQMPGASTNCKKDLNYIPDLEMEKLVIKRSGCIPKWTKLTINAMVNCSREKDFERYLEANIESQEIISKLPNKCNFNTWSGLHYEEEKMDGNTSIEIILLSINPKVNLIVHVHT